MNKLYKHQDDNLRYTFCRAEKLHSLKDFERVMKLGRRLVHPAIFIYSYQRNDNSNICRLGIVTSRKVGIAVDRNRLKRRLREIFRLNKSKLSPGLDMIFCLRKEAVSLNYHELELIILSLWQKGNLI